MKLAMLARMSGALNGVACCFVLVSYAVGQSFGAQQVVSTDVSILYSVYAADLDGDGDADVLSASGADDKVAWYENLGGGSFGPQLVITTSADGAREVYATDLDGDGDADVLSASPTDGKVAWYENMGGGSFGTQQIVAIESDGPTTVYAVDLDGDGDADVLSTTIDQSTTNHFGKVVWYENLGAGSFGPRQVITLLVNSPTAVYAADLDGDGDADVLSASAWDNKVAWYENLGAGSFGPQQEITNLAFGANSVHAADLDGDGDMDVLSASIDDSSIRWFENLGAGAFGTEQFIGGSTSAARDVYTADLDGDGDADVLAASGNGDYVAWYENLAAGSFGPRQVITNGTNSPRVVYATDLDSDGDVDVLSASLFDNKIAWYENFSAIGVRYCSPTFANSTGQPGSIDATGSQDLSLNDVTLTARSLPLNSFGFVITSRTQGYFGPGMGGTGGQGALCVVGSVGRFIGPGQIPSSGAAGSFSVSIDVDNMATPTGFVMAAVGETWNFQIWYRDLNPTITSNFTDAVGVTFQ